MSLKIVNFEAEHLIGLHEITPAIARQAVAIENNMRAGGLAWSAIEDGKCIGCCAVLNEGDKYTIWLTTTPALIAKPIWFHRESRRLFKIVKEKAAGLPIQILCDRSVRANLLWAERFGFKATNMLVLEAS